MTEPTMTGLTEATIRIENLKKSFRGGRDRVLDGIDLTFEAGTLTYILGPSGTGKSVLIKHLLGLLRPDSGRIWIGDHELTALGYHDMIERRLLFGMLFQNSALFDTMTVYDNVAFPLREHTRMTRKQIHDKVTSTLAQLGMESGYDKYPSELSGGMRKRVGLARAIVRKPSFLLYDEPTTGLDPVTRSTVDDLISQIKENLQVTSIVISHDILSALRLADHIAFLYQGKVVFDGDAEGFRKSTHPIIKSFLAAERRNLDA